MQEQYPPYLQIHHIALIKLGGPVGRDIWTRKQESEVRYLLKLPVFCSAGNGQSTGQYGVCHMLCWENPKEIPVDQTHTLYPHQKINQTSSLYTIIE